MFLSDELEEIVSRDIPLKDKVYEIKKTFFNRMKDPDKDGFTAYVNSIRSIDYAWQNFCKTHSDWKPEGFRESILNRISEDSRETTIKLLKWDKN